MGTHFTPDTVDAGTHDLILGCLPLVESIARRMHGELPPNSCVELNDLSQSGLLGLVNAGRGYDTASGVPFPIYARYRIEGEMLDSLRRNDLAPRRLRRWAIAGKRQPNGAGGQSTSRSHRRGALRAPEDFSCRDAEQAAAPATRDNREARAG